MLCMHRHMNWGISEHCGQNQLPEKNKIKNWPKTDGGRVECLKGVWACLKTWHLNFPLHGANSSSVNCTFGQVWDLIMLLQIFWFHVHNLANCKLDRQPFPTPSYSSDKGRSSQLALIFDSKFQRCIRPSFTGAEYNFEQTCAPSAHQDICSTETTIICSRNF